jgi:SAM-dependent methyltransferase
MHGTDLTQLNRTLAILQAAQEEVERLSTNDYYQRAYRESEVGCWSAVLDWLGEDFARISPVWPQRVLDVGCAYGTLLLVAKLLDPDCRLYGLDFVPNYMSLELVGRHGINFAISNVELDPLPWPGPFDVILLTEALEHFNFQAAPTLRKLRDALAPGGRVYLSTPDAAEWGRITTRYQDYYSLPEPTAAAAIVDEHVWHFSEGELYQVIHEAGLKVTRFAFSRAPGRPRHFNLTLEAA